MKKQNETLSEIFDKYRVNEEAGHADKGSIHSYIETYEKILAPFRNKCSILEIGIALGYSVKMWNDYFHNSYIVGNDLTLVFDTKAIVPKNFNKILYIEADGTKPEFLPKLGAGTFDVIIDDGSHMEADQIASFNLLKHRMNPGGIYIIEDILALDQNRKRFEALHHNCEIIDLRGVKNRFDDVLILYRF